MHLQRTFLTCSLAIWINDIIAKANHYQYCKNKSIKIYHARNVHDKFWLTCFCRCYFHPSFEQSINKSINNAVNKEIIKCSLLPGLNFGRKLHSQSFKQEFKMVLSQLYPSLGWLCDSTKVCIACFWITNKHSIIN